MAHVLDAVIQLRDNFSETLQRVERQMAQSSRTMKNLGRDVKNTGKSFESVGSGLTKAITLPIVGLGVAAIKTAIDSESAFAGIRKTVNATEEEYRQLRKEFDQLSLEIPIDKNELYAIGEAAGQLGIAKDHIVDFSETIAKLGVTTNMTTDEAASELAKFANITQMNMKDIDRLGSTIVDLGNNMATTEADIVAMGMRLAGAGTQVGMTEDQILSFSAALSSVGIEAEAGGSAFSKVMVNMQLAAETGIKKYEDFEKLLSNSGVSMIDASLAIEAGGKSVESLANRVGISGKELKRMHKEVKEATNGLEDFAQVAGVSSDEFAEMFKKDAAGAISMFIEGLASAEERGISAIAMLDEMGIKEVRLRDALLRAAGASDVFTEALDIGKNAWKENVALAKEAAERFGTTESKIQLLKNQFMLLGDHIGQMFLPYLSAAMDKITAMVEKFRGLDEGTQKTVIKFLLFAAAIGPVIFAVGRVVTIVGGGISKFGLLAGKVKKAGGIWKAITAPASLVVIKIIAIIAVIAAVIAIFVKLYKSNEEVRKRVDAAWSAIKEAVQTAISGIGAFWDTHGEAIKQKVDMAFKALGVIVVVAMDLIGGVISAVLGGIRTFWETHGEAIKQKASLIFEFIKMAITTAMEVIKTVVSFALDIIKDFWSKHGETIIAVISSAWDLIKAVFQYAMEFIGGVITVGLAVIQGIITAVTTVIQFLWSAFGETIMAYARTAWETIQGIISGALQIIKGVLDVFTGLITGNWQKVWDGLKSIVSGVWEGIKSIIKGGINGVINLINGFIRSVNKIQIPDNIPGVGGIGINIPLIPQLAKGTDFWEGGIVQVHEKGGEIIDLPKGSRVFPHDESVSMARAQGRQEGLASLARSAASATRVAIPNVTGIMDTIRSVVSKKDEPLPGMMKEKPVIKIAPLKEGSGGNKSISVTNYFTIEATVRKDDDMDNMSKKIAKDIARELEKAAMNTV